jgi:hypothetical protein
MASRPPLAGFNHNIRHADRVYHVQTEDSGVENPHLFTHVFLGGMIISSARTDYADLATVPNHEEQVRKMMQEQHKRLMKELRRGLFDEKIVALVGSIEPPEELAFELDGSAPAIPEAPGLLAGPTPSGEAPPPAAAMLLAETGSPSPLQAGLAATQRGLAEIPTAPEMTLADVSTDPEVTSPEGTAWEPAPLDEAALAAPPAGPPSRPPEAPPLPAFSREAAASGRAVEDLTVPVPTPMPFSAKSLVSATPRPDDTLPYGSEDHERAGFPPPPPTAPLATSEWDGATEPVPLAGPLPERELDDRRSGPSADATGPSPVIVTPQPPRPPSRVPSLEVKITEQPRMPSPMPSVTREQRTAWSGDATERMGILETIQQATAPRPSPGDRAPAQLPRLSVQARSLTSTPVGARPARATMPRLSGTVVPSTVGPALDAEPTLLTPTFYSQVRKPARPPGEDSGPMRVLQRTTTPVPPAPRETAPRPSGVFDKPLPGGPAAPRSDERTPVGPLQPRRSGVYPVPGAPLQRPPHPDPNVRSPARSGFPPAPSYGSTPQRYTAPSRLSRPAPRIKPHPTGSYERPPWARPAGVPGRAPLPQGSASTSPYVTPPPAADAAPRAPKVETVSKALRPAAQPGTKTMPRDAGTPAVVARPAAQPGMKPLPRDAGASAVVARPAVIISQPVNVGQPPAQRPRRSAAPPPLPAPPPPPAAERPKTPAVPPRAVQEPPAGFGAGLITERSLDEVILTYLAEDVEASDE